MLRPVERQPQESLLAPEHWGGYDIADDAFFDDKSPLHESLVSLTATELRQAQIDACENLAKIAAGNATEIGFNVGNEFTASTLNDGTIIAIERESLMRWTGGQYDKPLVGEPHWMEEYRPVSRPARAHWLEGQSKKAAGEYARFPQQASQYSRSMEWGVLLSRGDDRLALPFSFSSAKVHKDGSVEVNLIRSCAISLPLVLGSVMASGKLPLGECSIHALEKYNAIDVVHAAAGQPQPSRTHSRASALVQRLGFGVVKPASQ